MARDITKSRLLFQDTGDQIFRMPWPPTPQGFVDSFITPYIGSAIDAYCFCVNVAGTAMFYDSDVGEMYGQCREVFRGASALRTHEIIKRLCVEGNDPPKLAVEGARAAGMDCFLRLRMNDLHDVMHSHHKLDDPSRPPKIGTAEPCYTMTQFKKQHPELLLGNVEDAETKTGYERWEALAYNYALAPVREMIFGLADELLTRYEPDGLQLDFLRFPIFFARQEAYGQRHLLTDLVRRIRERSREVARQCGHAIHLIADVPEAIEAGLRAGVDTPTWLRDRLVDMVTFGRGYCPFGAPWTELAALAKEHGIPAIACLNYGKTSGWMEGGDGELGRQTLRAATHRALCSGMQGIFLWNHFYGAPVYDRWVLSQGVRGFDFTHDLVSRQALAQEIKTYELTSETHDVHGPVAWKGQVPMTISLAGSHIVVFDVPVTEDPPSARLWLQLLDAHFDDEILFSFNGEPIVPDASAWPGLRLFDHFEFVFDLRAGQLHDGENRLEIRLTKRDSRLEPFVTLMAGRLTVPGANLPVAES